MNAHYTRQIIAATVIALLALLTLLYLYKGSEALTASFAVIAALGFLATLELRGTGTRLKSRQMKDRSHA